MNYKINYKKIIICSVIIILIIVAIIIIIKIVNPSMLTASLTTNPPVDSHNNIAIGANALIHATGPNNIALGPNALSSNISGNDNFAFGANALSAMTTGHDNVAIGVNALSLGNGRYNFAIGTNAASDFMGNESIFLGINANALSRNDTNEIVIGNNSTGAGSNTVTLGNNSIIKTLLKGNVGIGTSNPMSKLHILDAVPRTGQLVIDGNSGKLYLGRDANIGWINVDSSESLELRTNNIGKLNILANGNIGIGTNNPITKLDVQGAIRTAPTNSSQCNNNTKGSIYYNSNDNHFYGCNGTTWKQLDNN